MKATEVVNVNLQQGKDVFCFMKQKSPFRAK